MFKNLFKRNPMKEETIGESIIKVFRKTYAEDRWNINHEDVTEITDDDILSIVETYLNKPTLTEANNYWYHIIDDYVRDGYKDIDWSMDREEVKKTPTYKQWEKHSSVDSAWSHAKYNCQLEEAWVEKNGKANTDEEAAKKAADKWCELIFGWHLQDNGAINENHGGGFYACALGTILANDCKEGITDDVKKKAHNLFYEYYRRGLHYNQTHDRKDIDWLVENLPDNSEKDPFDWKYFEFRVDLYCDYGPGTPLYLILVNAGVDPKDAGNICPWKTGIDIRKVDNAVMYKTYQHCEEI